MPDSLKLCPHGDADCQDPAQACDATLAACVARRRTCTAGDACDPQSKLCVHACGNDADCAQIEGASGYQCRANACFRRLLCNGDGDCSNTYLCAGNADGSKSCRLGCVSASDCPIGQGCSTTDPNHPRCTADCAQPADCPLNTTCVNRACSSTNGSCAQTCQTTAACPIGATCTNACCVGADFAAACQLGGAPSSVCPACTTSGCTPSCSQNCFILTLGACTSNNDCITKGYPGNVICTKQGQCQALAHLLPCSSSADCGAKGFQCIPRGRFGCGSDGSSVCVPQEQSAQVACGLGHN